MRKSQKKQRSHRQPVALRKVKDIYHMGTYRHGDIYMSINLRVDTSTCYKMNAFSM